MNIVILAIGKKHDPKLISAIEHYTKMLGSDAPSWSLLESRAAHTGSNEQTVQAEGELLLKHIASDDIVIALDEHGTQLTSPELAARLEGYTNAAVKRLVFVIGGAFGLSHSVVQRADFIWSLSKLVFPHQIVRLVLLEQLYRASTINTGKRYHY